MQQFGPHLVGVVKNYAVAPRRADGSPGIIAGTPVFSTDARHVAVVRPIAALCCQVTMIGPGTATITVRGHNEEREPFASQFQVVVDAPASPTDHFLITEGFGTC